jgi:DNA polymerase-3 subunit alpha
MVSLYRPGPMDNIPTYINRKFGREEIEYLDPKLEPILGETYGVIIYQEQVMQVAQELAGYSLGQADLLRRAMGKKIKEEMDKQRPRFVEGAAERGVPRRAAETIFDLLEKFASYGFNKSHAAAYALLAYQTAFLKANYPTEFMAAIMTLDQGNTDKVKMFIDEAHEMGLEILPPSINSSRAEFTPENGAIRFSLAALKNVGQEAMELLTRERDENGPFADMAAFAARLDPKLVNKRTLEMLASGGAFDDFGLERGQVHANADLIMACAQQSSLDSSLGQSSLFGDANEPPEIRLRPADGWTESELLEREKEATGCYLSGHPLDQYGALLDELEIETHADFLARIEILRREWEEKQTIEKERREEEARREAAMSPDERLKAITARKREEQNRRRAANVIPFRQGGDRRNGGRGEKGRDSEVATRLAGMVEEVQERRSKKGARFAFIAMTDRSGQFELLAFSDILDEARDHLRPGAALQLHVAADLDREGSRLRLLSCRPLESAAARRIGKLRVHVDNAAAFDGLAEMLAEGGRGHMELVLRLPALESEVAISLESGVKATPRAISRLRALQGVCEVEELS